MEDGWYKGTVQATYYREPDFPRGRCAAYHCELDGGAMIFASWDDSSTIRLLDSEAREAHAGKCLVRSVAAADHSLDEIEDLVRRLGLHDAQAVRGDMMRTAATFGRVPAISWALNELHVPFLEADSHGHTLLHLA
eukprot:4550384-Prymnesium_polylepis.1